MKTETELDSLHFMDSLLIMASLQYVRMLEGYDQSNVGHDEIF